MTTRKVVLITLALATLAAVTATYLSYQRDIGPSRQRLSGISKLIDTKSGPIEYAESGEGPVILVVHGAGGGFDQGLEILEPLVHRGYKLVAMSRFGYLRTALPANATVAAQADAHANLMDALGIEKAVIFGISAGGPSALQFAVSHPERCAALVLMVPLAYKPPEAAASAPRLSPLTEKAMMTIVGSDFAFWLGMQLDPNLVTKTVLGTPPGLIAAAGNDERMRVNQVMKHILPISERVRGIVNDSAIANALTRLDLASVKTPTLLLSARDDLYGTFASAEYTAGQIPGAKFIGYETGGHMLVGHDAEANDVIDAFLKANSAGLDEPNSQTMGDDRQQDLICRKDAREALAQTVNFRSVERQCRGYF